MADDNTFDYTIRARQEGDGVVAKATAELQELKGVAAEVGGGMQGVTEAAGESGGKLDELRETAIETGHGLHGAHLAMEGLSRAAEGGEGALSGAAFAARGLGMALSAGIWGIAAIALTAVTTLLSKFSEESAEAAKAIKDAGDESAAAKTKLEGLHDIATKLPDAESRWEAAIRLTQAALVEREGSLTRQAAAQERMAAAEEKLALARVDADASLNPDQKAAAKAAIEQQYDDQKAQAQIDRDNSQIEIEKKKIALANDASAAAAKKAAAASKAAADEISAQNELRKSIHAAKDEAGHIPSGTTQTEAGELLNDLVASQGDEGVAAQAAKNRARRDALEKQIKEMEDKLDDKGVQRKSDQAKKAMEAARKAAEDAAKTRQESGARIDDLSGDAKTTGGVRDIDKQTAQATAQARINTQNQKQKDDLDKLNKELEEKAAERRQQEAEEAAKRRAGQPDPYGPVGRAAGLAQQLADSEPFKNVSGPLSAASTALSDSVKAHGDFSAGMTQLGDAMKTFTDHAIGVTAQQRSILQQMKDIQAQVQRLKDQGDNGRPTN